ncbi:MAG: FAD-binding oxidoreductase [Nitratireductor sp.]|nr:FAD-binding oxidoreductase [Nitratireductor sp.]
MPIELLHANDREGRYPPSWYAETAHPFEEQPSLLGDERADVCIIGAGYTGLSAALHLREAGYDVMVLDAHRAGWGASGRNGGQVGTGQRLDQDALEEMLGNAMARRLWDLAEESKQAVRDLISRHQIDCEPVPGIIHADHRERFVPHSRAYAEKLNTTYDYPHIRFVDREEIRSLIGSPGYFGGTLDTDSFHIHPLNYALGLARAAVAMGVRLCERSEVMEIRRGDKVTVLTRNGSVVADHCIIACNGYLGDLEKSVASRVMPINNFIIATEPLSETLAKRLIANNAAVADSRFVINYFRLSSDLRLLFGGGENYGYSFPTDIAAFVRKPMLKVFPSLENIRITHGWGGTLAITVNRLPAFRRVEGNIVSASGFSGQGVTLATLAGRILAEAVRGQMERFDVMASLPSMPFPGGAALRWPMLVLAMTWFSLRDRL